MSTQTKPPHAVAGADAPGDASEGTMRPSGEIRRDRGHRGMTRADRKARRRALSPKRIAGTRSGLPRWAFAAVHRLNSFVRGMNEANRALQAYARFLSGKPPEENLIAVRLARPKR